jgi:GABA(A) receptor-associated protein
MEFQFKKQNPNLSKRKKDCENLLKNNPNSVPVICEKKPNCNLESCDKTRFLVPKDLNADQFIYLLRKRLFLNKDTNLFLIINEKDLIDGQIQFSEIYQKFKNNEDGFLYISYSNNI